MGSGDVIIACDCVLLALLDCLSCTYGLTGTYEDVRMSKKVKEGNKKIELKLK